MASVDVPVIVCSEFTKHDLPHIIKRGLKTGFMNFPNLDLDQVPNELLELFPLPEYNSGDCPSLVDGNDNDDDFDVENDEAKEIVVDTEIEINEPTSLERTLYLIHKKNDEVDSGSRTERNLQLTKLPKPEENVANTAYLSIVRLNMSSNQFTCIPVILCSLFNLQVLDFQDNKVTIIPHEIGLLQNLVRLVLSHNQIVELTSELYCLRNLRCLLLQDNKIRVIDPAIEKLALLEILDMSQNLLEGIPEEFGYLKRLTRLNLADNRISSLPEEIGRLEALQLLDLTHNYLNCLPCKIGELRFLEQLSARRNQITIFPSLSFCGALKELHLGGNVLREIPLDKLCPLVALIVLELRDNHIKNLPEPISILSNLVRLDLSGNDLEDLPNSLGSISSLKALTVDGNPLEHVTKKLILQRGTEEILEYLRNRLEAKNTYEKQQTSMQGDQQTISSREINTSQYLTAEDKQVLQYSRTLNYSRRHVKEIPEEVFSAALPFRITTMRLSRNRLTAVPVRIKDFLHLLTELDLSYNLLSELPAFLGYATHLRVLDIQDNQLMVLPKELVLLRHLQKLNISNNKFYQIPEILYEMHWLEMMFVCSNMIDELDAVSLCKMKSLQVLDVSNNEIKVIPYQLGHMLKLRRLQLSGNPFRQPRPNILARGTAYLMDWLRDRIPKTPSNNQLK